MNIGANFSMYVYSVYLLLYVAIDFELDSAS